jgi:hypothetical protein
MQIRRLLREVGVWLPVTLRARASKSAQAFLPDQYPPIHRVFSIHRPSFCMGQIWWSSQPPAGFSLPGSSRTRLATIVTSDTVGFHPMFNASLRSSSEEIRSATKEQSKAERGRSNHTPTNFAPTLFFHFEQCLFPLHPEFAWA